MHSEFTNARGVAQGNLLVSVDDLIGDLPPVPDFDATIAFLQRVRRKRGVVNLAALEPGETGKTADGKPFKRKSFLTVRIGRARHENEGLRDFLGDSHRRGWNLYWALNEPDMALGHRRASEADICLIYGLPLDLDPDKAKPFTSERERLLSKAEELRIAPAAPPTVIVDSGSGIQAFWLLDAPMDSTPERAALVKAHSRGLMHRFKADGADTTISLEHLFRLPGTVNFMSPDKIARGRRPALARVLAWTDRLNPVGTLDMIAPPMAALPGESGGRGVGNAGRRLPWGLPLLVLADAVKHARNEDLDWLQWSRIGMALRHECTPSPIMTEMGLSWPLVGEGEARDLWHEFSAKAEGKYDPDYTDQRWASFANLNATRDIRLLVDNAVANGWKMPVWEFDDLSHLDWTECDDLAEKAKMVKIQWDAANFRHHANSAGRAILRRGKAPAVLGHAGRLVYITYGQPSVVRDPNGDPLPVMPLIRAYDKPLLRERLSWDCAFEVPKTEPEEKGKKAEGDKKEKKIRWVPAAPPAMVVETLLARGPVGLGGEGHDAPYLAALVETPTLRPDGTVLDRPGYDSTGIFYFDTGVRFDPVADRPTLADAKRAYAVLRDEVFAEFPFATDLDRDVAVSLLLTALVVRSFGGYIPAFAVMAPVQSSGKTTVVDLVSRLVWGRPAPAMALPESDENVSKALLGILMEGQPCVLFDNVADGAVFKSEEIAKIITSEVYQARELSTHNNPIVACNILLTMTGNNIRLPGDMRSRVLRCRLDPGVESPEKRHFSRDLKEWAAANRGRVVSAILTLLRGWVVARESGCTVEAEGTRFKTWGRFVRDALVWAGGSDVANAFATEEEDDDDRTALRCLLDVLAEHADGMTPGEIINAHVDAEMNEDERITTVLGVVFGGRKPTPHGMGHWLKKKAGQVIGGRKLVSERDTHSKGARWGART